VNIHNNQYFNTKYFSYRTLPIAPNKNLTKHSSFVVITEQDRDIDFSNKVCSNQRNVLWFHYLILVLNIFPMSIDFIAALFFYVFCSCLPSIKSTASALFTYRHTETAHYFFNKTSIILKLINHYFHTH
jgi:hypothetical protein